MWFVLTALYAVIVWALFFYDLRIIELRMKDSAGPAGNRLYAMVGRDQRLNIMFVIPVIFLFNAGCALAIHSRPDYFLRQNGHLILIACQGITLLLYLAYVIRAFIQLAPLISATRAEWRTEVADPSS